MISNDRPGVPARGNAVLLSIALGAVLLEVIPTLMGGYGYFIDEWYYIACARRIAFGFVDHPPLAPLLLKLTMWVAGSSLVAIRILPALALGVTVFVTGLMARDLGGGVVAQAISGISAVIAPAFLLLFGFFSMNAFEVLLWVLCSWTLVRILKGGDPRLWLQFGLLFGIGFENKHTILLFGACVAAGLLLTPSRREFLGRNLWIGAGVAFLLCVPNLLWQAFNGWPSLEFYANQMAHKNIPTPPLNGIANQLFLQNPGTLPVWACGAFFLLFSKEGKEVRALGLLFAALFIFQIASLSSRPDRIAGIYPLLFASGGVAIEAFVRRTGRTWIPSALCAVLALFGLLLAPVGLPILPPETLADYCSTVGVIPKLERGKTSPLPQWFADRFEWESFVGTVKELYDNLSPADRSRAVVFAPSYGHAGALEFYAPSLGLPRVICNQNSYYMWSEGNADADVLIAIGARASDLRSVYASVDSIGVIRGKYGMSWRNNMKIYLAREPTTPLNAVWGGIKHYE